MLEIDRCYREGPLWWFSGKESASNAGDMGSILGLGRFPRERNGNPLQYSCLGNPMDRGAGQASVHGVAQSDMTLGLNNNNNVLKKKKRVAKGVFGATEWMEVLQALEKSGF